MTIRNLGTALILATGLLAASSQASVTKLVLNGTPGDFITGGITVDNVYSSADPLLLWNFVEINQTGTAAAPATNYLSFIYMLDSSAGPDDKYATLDFNTWALDVSLKEGMTYKDAQRSPYADAGHPAMTINYDHRGCNTLTGDFTVNRLRFDGTSLAEFDGSFNQSCDGGALMHGSLYYNAALTALPESAVPEPATLALFGLGMAGAAAVGRRKRRG
jgi:hypothetical protein